jgi:hypothetical protein
MLGVLVHISGALMLKRLLYAHAREIELMDLVGARL